MPGGRGGRERHRRHRTDRRPGEDRGRARAPHPSPARRGVTGKFQGLGGLKEQSASSTRDKVYFTCPHEASATTLWIRRMVPDPRVETI
eukprot:scaffold19639_cov65-Phaeocystis_antarctica.AAC.4